MASTTVKQNFNAEVSYCRNDFNFAVAFKNNEEMKNQGKPKLNERESKEIVRSI